MQVIAGADRFGAGQDGAPHWVEHLRVTDLSVGTYSLPAGSLDDQEPHTEDEIYVVVRGHATFAGTATNVAVGPGTTIHVPAGEEHRFVDITDDLVSVVIFAPAEGTR